MTAEDEAKAARMALVEHRLNELEKKVDTGLEHLAEIRDVLTAARGAKWALVGFATLGGAMAGTVHKWLPFLR